MIKEENNWIFSLCCSRPPSLKCLGKRIFEQSLFPSNLWLTVSPLEAMLQKKQIILKIKLLAVSLSICHLSSVFFPLPDSKWCVCPLEKRRGHVSLMLIYSLLCFCLSPSEQQQGSWFFLGPISGETNPADISGIDWPALSGFKNKCPPRVGGAWICRKHHFNDNEKRLMWACAKGHVSDQRTPTRRQNQNRCCRPEVRGWDRWLQLRFSR